MQKLKHLVRADNVRSRFPLKHLLKLFFASVNTIF